MSVKNELSKAKQLIKAKQYEDARAILITIDHPLAEKWLSKLPAPTQDTKGTQKQMSVAGCAVLIAILVLCGLIFVLLQPNATVDNIRLAVIELESVRHIEGIITSEVNPQVWIDTCLIAGYDPDTTAQQITQAVRRLRGLGEKQIFVITTDSIETRSYENGVFFSASEREFC